MGDHLKRKCFKCGNRYSDDIRLYRFPKPGIHNIIRCEIWAKYVFPDKPWSSVEFQMELYTKHKMLCGRHFKKEAFFDHDCTKLRKHAVPNAEENMDQTMNSANVWCTVPGEILSESQCNNDSTAIAKDSSSNILTERDCGNRRLDDHSDINEGVRRSKKPTHIHVIDKNDGSEGISLPSTSQEETVAAQEQSIDIISTDPFTLPPSCENKVEVTSITQGLESGSDAEENYENDYSIHSDDVEDIEDETTTHQLDEIDSLFLSYAGVFRKLAPNIQTKLKLDIAKLFARYELKNELVKVDCPQTQEKKKTNITEVSPGILLKESSQQKSFESLEESSVEPLIAKQNSAPGKTYSAVKYQRKCLRQPLTASVSQEVTTLKELSATALSDLPIQHVVKRKCLSKPWKVSISLEDTTENESAVQLNVLPTEYDVKRKCLREPLMAPVTREDSTQTELSAPPPSVIPPADSQDDTVQTNESFDNNSSSVVLSRNTHPPLVSMPLLSSSALQVVASDIASSPEYLDESILLDDEILYEETLTYDTLDVEISRTS